MFSGAFVYTSDSRFPNQFPIPVHDRSEVEETRDEVARKLPGRKVGV